MVRDAKRNRHPADALEAWIEELGRSHAVPTVKLRFAAIRHLFPGHDVRGPSYSAKKDKTHVLPPGEARQFFKKIPTEFIIDQSGVHRHYGLASAARRRRTELLG